MNAKQVIIILVIFLSVEIIASATLIATFKRWSENKSTLVIYHNPNPWQDFLYDPVFALTLKTTDKSWEVNSTELKSWIVQKPASKPVSPLSSLTNYFYYQTGTIHPWTSYNFSARVRGLEVDEQIFGQFLLQLAGEKNREPQDAKLTITQGRATNFVPDQEGQILDLAAARKLIKSALALHKSKVQLPFITERPQTILADLNDLGIKEFLGRGQTDFSGSSNSRITNIRVGASRYQGLIIQPGEEFSFNKHLGPIDAAHGFLPELVIKPEGTVPEFGGGLCQVSSTMFRAAFFTGLPIIKRRNHSYPVKYYEWIADDKPRAVGLDATIYPGAQDLKFVNDTPAVILVWTKIEGKRLYFDFYGTSDERKVIVDGPHEYDRRGDGAVKSEVKRQVIKNGALQELTFNSVYVSPNLYPRVYEYPKPETVSTTTPLNN